MDWSEFLTKISPNYIVNQSDYREDNENDELLHPFSMLELEYALKHNTNASPGIDEVIYSMLFHFPLSAKKLLSSAFNDMGTK